MCPHVLCLSLIGPPPTLLSPNKWALFTFFLFLIPLFLCVYLSLLVFGTCILVSYNWIPRNLLQIFSSSLDSMKSRMQNLKKEFLKKWIKGLQIYKNIKKDMTIFERKRAIKLSADVAIASTRTESTHWSRALMTNVCTDNFNNAVIVEEILGRKVESKPLLITCSNKILRRTRLACHKKSRKVVRPIIKASSIAKKLVKNRTRVLKSLVPGGQEMDEVSLIKETLDYIASLRVQVDVMRRIAAAAERLDHPKRLF